MFHENKYSETNDINVAKRSISPRAKASLSFSEPGWLIDLIIKERWLRLSRVRRIIVEESKI